MTWRSFWDAGCVARMARAVRNAAYVTSAAAGGVCAGPDPASVYRSRDPASRALHVGVTREVPRELLTCV
ncbi:hypothetical protein [Pseudarthrobacter sp. SSS035]|uniref:hypothetical protein n=1 Tax=Pseudarthrobacter sp. SSS035 TaxID=2931399 RepID=UPI002010BEF8|nr:hypothetical protein [Pseudarthrobacter sp. SSS035]